MALALALLAAWAYSHLAVARLHLDANLLLGQHLEGRWQRGLHLGYLSLARVLALLLPEGAGFRSPWLVSHLAGGLAAGASFLLARRLSLHRARALCLAIAVGTAPAALFFAATIEVHALHFAALTCAVLVLLGTARLPLGAGLAWGAAVVAVLPLTHQSAPLLGPGLVLCFLAARDPARPFGPLRVVLLTSAVLALAMMLGVLLSSVVRHGGLGHALAEQLDRVGHSASLQAQPGAGWPQWLGALGLLGGLALAGLWRLPRALWWIPALAGPPNAAFMWWRVPEQGGYFLPTAALLGLLAARVLPRSEAWAAATLLAVAAGGAALGLHRVRSFDSSFDPAVRVELVRELGGEKAIVLGFLHDLPDLRHSMPAVEQHSLAMRLVMHHVHAGTPEAFAEETRLAVAVLLERAAGRKLLVDLSDPESFDRVPLAADAAPFMDALRSELERRFELQPLERDGWSLARVLGPRSAPLPR